MMRKILFLSFAFCLLAISAVAQNRPDYSGEWELDTINSRMDERMRAQSISLKVNQTKEELTVGTFIKRQTQGNGENVVPPAITYSLVEGRGTTAEMSIGGGESRSETARYKASFSADGKLNLSSERKIKTQAGETIVNTREAWELADEGKTLKIMRSMETAGGTETSELIFTKKERVENSADTNNAEKKPRVISGGVVNGKALKLVKPELPATARIMKVAGAVSVQVTIDEKGDVISAVAVSGHSLLRQAAEDAAKKSKFRPIAIDGVPVKVTGVIVYNFVP